MMYWSWILGAVSLIGFILAGRKVWWSWYVNLGCQALWFAYAFATRQYGFVVTALVYTFVFGQNAWRWTKEHRQAKSDPYWYCLQCNDEVHVGTGENRDRDIDRHIDWHNYEGIK